MAFLLFGPAPAANVGVGARTTSNDHAAWLRLAINRLSTHCASSARCLLAGAFCVLNFERQLGNTSCGAGGAACYLELAGRHGAAQGCPAFVWATGCAAPLIGCSSFRQCVSFWGCGCDAAAAGASVRPSRATSGPVRHWRLRLRLRYMMGGWWVNQGVGF